jgi:hypothetical protein
MVHARGVRVKDLPPGALYVMTSDFPSIAAMVRQLTALGRADVTVVTPMFLDPEALNMLPTRRPVVVAAGVRLAPEQQKVLEWYTGVAP